jgi:predicted RNA-binding protein with PIN domain
LKNKVLIVDGHSIIFAWDDLRQLHQRKTGIARERLIKVLTEFQDATEIHVVVVFDGRGPNTNESSDPAGIQVFYASADRTADDVVERLTAKYADRYSITVATDDQLEQQTAWSFGAVPIGAEALRELVQSARKELESTLRTHSRRK